MNIRTLCYLSLLLSAVSAMNWDDQTPEQREATFKLIIVAYKGNIRQVTKYLSRVHDVNARNDEGCTALIQAAWMGHRAVVRLLLAAGADPNAATNSGCTALMLAATYGHAEVVTQLLEMGSGASEVLNAKNNLNPTKDDGKKNMTALMLAATYGRSAVVGILLAAGADPNLQDYAGKTALELAQNFNKTEVVAILQKYIDEAGLIKAAKEGNMTNDFPLIANGADVDAHDANGIRGAGGIPAPDEGDKRFQRFTKLGGYGSMEPIDEAGLIKAAKEGNMTNDFLTALNANGADVDAHDANGFTALMWAAMEGHEAFVRALIEAGADVDATNEGVSALDLAEMRSSNEAVIELLENAIISGRRRLALGELSISTLVLGIAASLLLLGYLVYLFNRRLTAKRQPVDTDLTTDLESGPAPRE